MISPHDEVTLKRVMHEVLNEREQRQSFNIFMAIESVRQAYGPLMSREERQRWRFEDILRPIDAELEILATEIAVTPPQGDETVSDHQAERAFVLIRDYRRAAKAAKEQGIEDIAQRCIAQGLRIERFLMGDADDLRTNDSQE